MDNNILDAILHGWKLFPAFWDAKEKHHVSYIKWATESTSDHGAVKKWQEDWPSCHICVNLVASNLTVLDVDMKHGSDGMKSLAELEATNGKLEPTLKVNTPSGGVHYYFEGSAKTSVGKLGKGLDTPAMVPLAGQTVQGKGAYQIVADMEPAKTPQWIVDAVGTPRDHEQKGAELPAELLNLPHNMIKAVFQASTNSIPIESGQRNHTIYQIACEIRDLAIDPVNCVSILHTVNARRCVPPLSDKEVAATVAHVYQYARSSVGSATPEADFSPIATAPVVEIASPKGVFRLSDFSGAAPARKWLVQDWLPEGELVALYGPPGSGKSLIALQLSLSIASGSKWLGLDTTKLPVLLVACEDSAEELHRRVEAVKNDPACAFIFDDPDTLKNWYGWPRVGFDNVLARPEMAGGRLAAGNFWGELTAQIKLMPEGPKLIVLDTIADIFAGNENERPAVNAFLKTILGGLRIEFDATVLIVGHPAKSTDSQYSGSTAWDGGVRSRWYMSRYDNEKPGLQNYRTLSRAKANYAAINGEDTKLVLQWMNGSFVPTVEADIIDNRIDQECYFVYSVIAEEAETGTLLNNHASALKNIYRWPRLKDSNGKPMARKLIDECLAKLSSDGLIEKTRGVRNNGYSPTYAGNTETEYRRIDKDIKEKHENRGK
jgi:hypothetical protein